MPGPRTDITSNGCQTRKSNHAARHFATRLHGIYTSLADSIEGIEDRNACSRYALVLLYRLTSLFALQHKGLLARDCCYLQRRLHLAQQQQAQGRGFYRDVLHPLFTAVGRSEDFPAPLTHLFIEPAREASAPAVSIPDAVFARIFALFDDSGGQAGDPSAYAKQEFGPEMLGVLFEQQISQKEMGAYYTPADVTTYIVRNTLLPALFTRVRERCAKTGICMDALWQQFAQQPERYFFAAPRKGCGFSLPPEIAAGCQDVTQRRFWQETGTEPYALPGETWREVITRHTRLDNIAACLGQSSTAHLNRLVTWNLNQQLLALDLLQSCQQPELLEIFYQSLRHLTILDPTCGSGAFLFAALDLLESLYTACLARMEELLSTDITNGLAPGWRRDFLSHLEEAGGGEQRTATTLLRIIECNLYGVDLMGEAVEICRLRLFLKVLTTLTAHHESFFPGGFGEHVRVGNSLVGSLDTISREVAHEQTRGAAHRRAFHWGLEFPAVMSQGGFDVIVGNPPYVEYERVRQYYTVEGYATMETGNLYALTMERSSHLLAPGGRFGMIVPSSATCTDGYRSLQKLLLAQQELHIASFSDQRARLFAIPHPRLCIICYEKSHPLSPQACRVFTTSYLKLEKERRVSPFECLNYIEVTQHVKPGIIPRYGSPLELSIHTTLSQQVHSLRDYLHPAGEYHIYFTRKLSWFAQVTPFIPLILDDQGQRRAPSELKTLRFASSLHARIAFAALNSNLFYWLITTRSDCRNLNLREVLDLPLDLASISPSRQQELCKLSGELERDLQANSVLKSMAFQTRGRLTIQCLYPARSKRLIDEIDRVLARHYGFSAEELDFLLHYDAKFRLPASLLESSMRSMMTPGIKEVNESLS